MKLKFTHLESQSAWFDCEETGKSYQGYCWNMTDMEFKAEFQTEEEFKSAFDCYSVFHDGKEIESNGW